MNKWSLMKKWSNNMKSLPANSSDTRKIHIHIRQLTRMWWQKRKKAKSTNSKKDWDVIVKSSILLFEWFIRGHGDWRLEIGFVISADKI